MNDEIDENDEIEEVQDRPSKFDQWIDDLSKVDLRERIRSITFLSIVFSLGFFSLTFYLLTTNVSLDIKGKASWTEQNIKRTTFHASVKNELMSFIKESQDLIVNYEGKRYPGIIIAKKMADGKSTITFVVEKNLSLEKEKVVFFSIPVVKKSYLDLLIENKDTLL